NKSKQRIGIGITDRELHEAQRGAQPFADRRIVYPLPGMMPQERSQKMSQELPVDQRASFRTLLEPGDRPAQERRRRRAGVHLEEEVEAFGGPPELVQDVAAQGDRRKIAPRLAVFQGHQRQRILRRLDIEIRQGEPVRVRRIARQSAGEMKAAMPEIALQEKGVGERSVLFGSEHLVVMPAHRDLRAAAMSDSAERRTWRSPPSA